MRPAPRRSPANALHSETCRARKALNRSLTASRAHFPLSTVPKARAFFDVDQSSRSTSAIHRFRNTERQQVLHPYEKALLVVTGSALVFLPWALGGMPRWAQWISLGLSCVAFVLAILPRTYDDHLTRGPSFRLRMLPRLWRFPFFWLGLAYFALVLIQIANPAWTYIEKDRSWWMESLEHIAWLPHGVEGAPFRYGNPWRVLLIHGFVWLLVCAIWVGLTRRRGARWLLMTIALNGVVLATIAILQRLTGTDRLLWFWQPPASYFVATFIYKNHAGIFFALMVALCAAFAWWHADRASRRLTKSHPGLLFSFLAVVVAIALLFTYARASTTLGFGYLAVIGIAYLIHARFRRAGGAPPLVNAVTTLLCAAFLALCAYSLNIERVWAKFGRLFDEDKTVSIEHRQLATRAAIDMGNDSPVFGHGAGSFRWVFPQFQRNYPEIFLTTGWANRKQVQRRLVWEHAHNDYAELFAEWGWTGVAFAAALLSFIVVAARRAAVHAQPAMFILLGGTLLVALGGAVDFPLHNPAILTTTAAVVALTLRWSAMERTRRQLAATRDSASGSPKL